MVQAASSGELATAAFEPEIDIAVLAEAFDLPSERAIAMVRGGAITSRCYRGAGEHDGTWKIVFYNDGKRLTLTTDANGTVLHRSTLEYPGDAGPAALRKAAL